MKTTVTMELPGGPVLEFSYTVGEADRDAVTGKLDDLSKAWMHRNFDRMADTMLEYPEPRERL